jgi:predicted metal-dependent HD superfamily phosphohydrolase
MNEAFPALAPLVLDRTLRRWEEPHRRWHGRAHLDSLLEQIEGDPALNESDREMLRYVALFHDAIYEPLATGNEEQSARLASLHLTNYPRRVEVISLIMATKSHQSNDALAKKFNGWDCAILRETSWERLLEYEEGIAYEYRELDRETYRRERSEFLKSAAESYENPLLGRLADEVEGDKK